MKGNTLTIFLQTATTTAYANGAEIRVRNLMDSGSQRTYVTDALKNNLSLSPERSKVLNLNTFGSDQVEICRCDLVRLQLKRQTKDIEITALSFPKICAPLSTLDIDKYPHLELADESLLNDTSSDVDVLIRFDFYYDIITGDIRRGDEGPCAVNSEFGWLVCGIAKAKGFGYGETVANFVVNRADISSCDALVSNEAKHLTDVLHKF